MTEDDRRMTEEYMGYDRRMTEENSNSINYYDVNIWKTIIMTEETGFYIT